MALAHKRPSVGAPVTPFYVNEPDGGGPLTTHQIIQAIRWYTDNCSDEKAASFLGTDVVTAKRFITLAWVVRLISRGFTFPVRETESLNLMRGALATYQAEVAAEKEEKAPKVSIQDLVKGKAMDYLNAIEATIQTNQPTNWYEFAVKLGVKSTHVPHMLAEIEVEKTQVSEARAKVYEQISVDLKKLQQNAAGTRAPRKRKVIKPEKIIGSLQFLKDHTVFKLKSIDPEKIIGAQSLWIFNTVYKTLAHYVAQGPNGLTVSGTTIKGFEGDQSLSKTVRKPEAVLGEVVAKTRKQAEKLFEELTTKPGKATGRVNKDCIILKAE